MAKFDLNAFVALPDVQRTKEKAEKLLCPYIMTTTQLLKGCTHFDVLEHTIAATTARFFKADGTSIIARIEYDKFHDIKKTNRITNDMFEAGYGVCEIVAHNPNDPPDQQSDVLHLGGNEEIRVTFSRYVPGEQASPALYYDKDPERGIENYKNELGPLVRNVHSLTPRPGTREFNPLVWAASVLERLGGFEAFRLDDDQTAKLEKVWARAVQLRDKYFPEGHTDGLHQSELAYAHGELNPRNCYWRFTDPDDPENTDKELALLDFVTMGVTTKELAALWDAVRPLDGKTHFGREGTFEGYDHGYSADPDGIFRKSKIDVDKVTELAEISDAIVFTIMLYYGMLPGHEDARATAIDRLNRYVFGPEGRKVPWSAHQTQQQKNSPPSAPSAATTQATLAAGQTRRLSTRPRRPSM